MQESQLHDPDYGRPGLGRRVPAAAVGGLGQASKLIDPVYASTKFFRALVKVPGYLQMPLYQAAQDVQHSADGYGLHELPAAGGQPVRARSPADAARRLVLAGRASKGKAQLDPGPPGHLQAFGPLPASRSASSGDAPSLLVQAPQPSAGLGRRRLAGDPCREYRLHEVRYAGFRWPAPAGRTGGRRTRVRPPGRSPQLIACGLARVP